MCQAQLTILLPFSQLILFSNSGVCYEIASHRFVRCSARRNSLCPVLRQPRRAQANYQWDPHQTTLGSDGSGHWDSGTNWANSGSNVAWQDGKNAVIGYGTGAAGTITLGNVVTPNSITFNPAGSGNYVITGGSINLTTNTLFTLNTDATISSQLVGSGTLSIAGTGTLTITNTNTFGGVDYYGNPYGIVSIHQGANPRQSGRSSDEQHQ